MSKPIGRPPLTDEQRRSTLLARVTQGQGCWSFEGRHRSEDNRPYFRRRYAYALVYEAMIGPIPEGMILHHTCDNTACVNPDHLEPMTQSQHAAEHLADRNRQRAADRTHCPQGHEYDQVVNDKRGGTWRRCSTCSKETKRRWRSRIA